MRTESELNRVSRQIIGGAIAIHRAFGPGCFESAYARCLAYELAKRQLTFEDNVKLTLRYETIVVTGAYVADFIVEGGIVVELKAIEAVAPIHIRQLQTYLRLTGCPLGLILNFGALTLTDGIARQVNNFPIGTTPYAK
ncbi:MAG: GxxExxY protein [Vicinamibacterales bacterium]